MKKTLITKDDLDALAIGSALLGSGGGGDPTVDKLIAQRTEIISVPTIKHYKPDSWAALKWLSIRQRENWTDVSKMEITGNVNHNIVEFF